MPREPYPDRRVGFQDYRIQGLALPACSVRAVSLRAWARKEAHPSHLRSAPLKNNWALIDGFSVIVEGSCTHLSFAVTKIDPPSHGMRTPYTSSKARGASGRKITGKHIWFPKVFPDCSLGMLCDQKLIKPGKASKFPGMQA